MKKWIPGLLVIVTFASWMIFREKPRASEQNSSEELQKILKQGRVTGEAKFEPNLDMIKLADWLDRPRADLAVAAKDLEKEIEALEKARTLGQLKVKLLTDLRIPLAIPVWRQAEYSKAQNMVLPPYLKEGDRDADLAVHLARNGDLEAARKIAPDEVKPNLDVLALDRNFPAEWTRFVGLQLHLAHLDLAQGNIEGAMLIASIHRQLMEILGEKGQASPLGAALLPKGKRIFEDALVAWGKENREQYVAWAKDTVLPHWGASHPWKAPAETPRWLTGDDGLLKKLDLLAIPLPESHLGSIQYLPEQAAFFVYQPTLIDVYESRHIDYWLAEQGGVFPINTLLAGINPYARGIVQTNLSADLKTADLPRTFGPVSLDRSFEINRRLFAWSRPRQSTLAVSDEKLLYQVEQPYAGAPVLATLEQDPDRDLVQQIQFAYKPTFEATDWLLPLWRKFGVGMGRVSGDRKTDGIEWSWQQGETKLTLVLPNDRALEPTLTFVHVPGANDSLRAELVAKKDLAERKARIEAGKPVTHARRVLEPFQLGMTQVELDKALKAFPSHLKQPIEDGVLITFNHTPQPGTEWTPRQGVARFDKDGKLVEARVRVTDVPGVKGSGVSKLLELLKSRSGPPEVVTLNSANWADVPDIKIGKSQYRWLDDVTLQIARPEASGAEIILRDCPVDAPSGLAMKALELLPRGPNNCAIGTKRADLLKNWRVQTPQMIEEALVLTPGEKSPYDSLLVWFEGDKVSRVVARYRIAKDQRGKPGEALLQVWGANAFTWGWPWLSEKAPGLSTYDDATRLRLHWNQGELYAEWKQLH